MRSGISKAIETHGSAPVILDCSNVHGWLLFIFFLEHFLDNAYCSVLFFIEFDFTAARGMGALNKELTRENVPLYLLKPSKEIIVILKESTNADIPTLDNPDDLESLLEQSK